MTSVKEFRVDREPTPGEPGRGRFVFTDDYSVFDWGRMPDAIPKKGRSLCTMGAHNFELLAEAGVPTHYRGVGSEAVPLDCVESPPREMAIDLTVVPDLPYDADPAGTPGGDANFVVDADDADSVVDSDDAGYDYDAFHAAAGDHYLVPLEIVFRNAVPAGSSLRTRATPAELGLPFDDWPDEAVALPDPVVEFSTKYEEQDRYLNEAAADRIAGRASLDDLRETALAVNRVVTDRAEEAGFAHEDGKIECLWVDGEVRVADVAGTLDENRFAYDGQQVSKEVVRQFYKEFDPDWVAAVGEAKARAEAEGVADWRPLCEASPEPLPERVVAAVADCYAAGTNAYTDARWFDAPAVDAAVDAVREL